MRIKTMEAFKEIASKLVTDDVVEGYKNTLDKYLYIEDMLTSNDLPSMTVHVNYVEDIIMDKIEENSC